MSRRPNTPGAAAALRGIVAELMSNTDQRLELAQARRDIRERAKSLGFDDKAIEIAARRRMMDREARMRADERAALAEIYGAAIGDLEGTPLGDAARARLASPPPDPGEDTHPFAGTQPAATPADADPPPPEKTVEEARAMGAEAARAGERIFANPFSAGDPKRAAWDAGWCEATGSDGMDIPPAFRRTPKPKKDKPAEPPGNDDEATK